MDTKTDVGTTTAAPTAAEAPLTFEPTDDELRVEALRRWRRGDRNAEDLEGAASDNFVKRQFILDELQKLGYFAGAKATRRVCRMHARIAKLGESVEETKKEFLDGLITRDKAMARIRRLCLQIIPDRKLVFWATCEQTKKVRDTYKANKPAISALWEEFRSLGEPSVQDNREAIGERDADGMWGGEAPDGRFVRDADGDWDEIED
jgi:hypothetical protein